MERLDVRLRRLRAGDSAMVRSWRNSPRVADDLITNHTISAEEHEAWLRRVLDSDDCRYWIICVDDRPVGLASVVDIDRMEKRCRWGFYNAEVDLRGRGIVTAALTSVLDHIFGELGLDVVAAEVLASNAASLAVHHRLGFEIVERVPGAVHRDGRDVDLVLLKLTAREWHAGRAISGD
jgi:UDP-4-amino-4,6-dideoxy-N-acetyl-beta-L-altrosamine N-acetyltransferase